MIKDMECDERLGYFFSFGYSAFQNFKQKLDYLLQLVVPRN